MVKKVAMKYLFFVKVVFLFSCVSLFSQGADSLYVKTHFDKFEYRIPMRDGIQLFTVVYTPKDKSMEYPILMNRTCYNASRYSDFKFRQPSKYLVEELITPVISGFEPNSEAPWNAIGSNRPSNGSLQNILSLPLKSKRAG